MNLDDLQDEVAEWSRRNFPNNTPIEPLLGLMEELGELAHAHLKGQQGIRHTADEIEYKKRDALGDLIIQACDYASRGGFHLSDAVLEAWEQVRKRDWLSNPMTAAE